eukprot:scaffold152296_cov40-Attheya_sp.AAC.1
MENIATLYEVDDDAKRAKIVKGIMRAEAQAAMYQVLRKYLRPCRITINYITSRSLKTHRKTPKLPQNGKRRDED